MDFVLRDPTSGPRKHLCLCFAVGLWIVCQTAASSSVSAATYYIDSYNGGLDYWRNVVGDLAGLIDRGAHEYRGPRTGPAQGDTAEGLEPSTFGSTVRSDSFPMRTRPAGRSGWEANSTW